MRVAILENDFHDLILSYKKKCNNMLYVFILKVNKLMPPKISI